MKKEYTENSTDYIIGRNPVLEALHSAPSIEKIYILHGSHGNVIEQIKYTAKQKGIVCSEISSQKMRELSQGNEAQGVLALRALKEYVDTDDMLHYAAEKGEHPFLLILDEIEDPQNLGAIIRTAECCGVHGVVLPKHFTSSITATVAKTSAGAVEYVRIAKVTNIVSEIEYLKEKGLWIVGTKDSATTSFIDYDYVSPIAIVIGNEGKGMRKLVAEHCDVLVKIPLFGRISSLNASVASALVLYEAVRKRKSIK